MTLFKTPHFIRTIKWLLIGIMLIAFPSIAAAGWLDFIGTTVKATAAAYVHTIYINAVERQIVTLSFLVYSILATIQGIIAFLVIRNFRMSFESANKDNKIEWLEGILLGTQAFITVVISVGLILFASFLFYTVYDGIEEIRSYKGLGYEQVQND